MCRRPLIWWCYLVCLLCAGGGVVRANGLPNFTMDYSSRAWRAEDGVPQTSVHAVEQTPDGYLWLATQNGLARFDGEYFTHFDKKKLGLKSGWIGAMCTDKEGALWFGSVSGDLGRMQDGQFTLFGKETGIKGEPILDLFVSRENVLWIGTRIGVYTYEKGKFARYEPNRLIRTATVRHFEQAKDGTIWAATSFGLAGIRTNEVFIYDASKGLSNVYSRSVCCDRDGSLWVGSNNGVTHIKEGQCTFYSKRDGLVDNTVSALYQDARGNLWAGTYGGLSRWNGQKFVSQMNAQGDAYDLIRDFFEDREGNLWVSAKDGLYRLNVRRFTTLTTRHGLGHNNVMAVREDRAGDVWFTTWGGGVHRIHDGTMSIFTRENVKPFATDLLLALGESHDGSFWVGAEYNGGLYRYGTNDSFYRVGGIADNAIRVIYEDRATNQWIGTSVSLIQFREGKMSRYTSANGLPVGKAVRDLWQDRAGTLWVGTDGGLLRAGQGNFTLVDVAEGFTAESAICFYEDAEGTLWVGTNNEGLYRRKNGRFEKFDAGRGLFDDAVHVILEDSQGLLWIGSRHGVFRVAKADFDAVAAGKLPALRCLSYDTADGLMSLECNSVARPSAWKDRHGLLWFATAKGLSVVDPKTALEKNEVSPPVVIQRLVAGGEDIVPQGGTVELRPGQTQLEFHYGALSYRAPEKNRYQYRLEGEDADWVEAGNRRFAHYAVLPGEYKFQVKAANNDGVWNDVPASLTVVVRPFFWQTLGFRLGLGVVGLAIIFLAHRLRVARVQALERLRVRIAADLHDDVGARLTKIAMLTEQVDRNTPETEKSKELVRNIAHTTHEVVRAMDEIVWTINPKNDNLDDFANYIFHYTQEFFQGSPIRCRLDVPPQLPPLPLNTEARHHLFLAFKEALNNTAKYSGATEVRVTLAATATGCVLTVEDNGKGFDARQVVRNSNGLLNMQQRLQQIGGTYTVETAPGEGTKIRLEIRNK